MPTSAPLAAVMLVLLAASAAPAQEVQGWGFDDGDAEGWRATGDLRDLSVRDGTLVFSTSGDDPGIILQPFDFTPAARHWVRLRVRASHTGNAQLFWFPRDGQGVGEATFHIPRAGDWVDLAVFPGWGQSGPLGALRLDTYHFGDGCAFEVDRIAVCEWPAPEGLPAADSWVFSGPGANARWSDWQPAADTDVFMSPPLDGARIQAGGWVEVRVRSSRACVLAVLWSDAITGRIGRVPFPVRGDGGGRPYFVQVGGEPLWSGRCALVGLEVPLVARDSVSVEGLALCDGPSGPPEIAARYFGFEDGASRAGRACWLTATVENIGGSTAPASSLRLELPAGLALAGDAGVQVPALEPRERATARWQVEARAAGRFTVSLREQGATPALASTELAFRPAREVTAAAYVPEPRPVATDLDVFMFYFPGWESPARWAPIRSEAPERKPVLGWYDEANPECVDWQIKWARENGISGFILDWYWNQGQLQLDHWLRAYRAARYRDQLKLFLLWCDHGSNDVHAPEDMRAIARYWIDNVFALPGYYRLEGRPVVALFEPDRLRAALGGSERVREALGICQEMAREAGYPGIAFLSSNNNFPAAWAPELAAEGYWGATTYHEPGYDYHDCPSQQMRSYAKQVATAPEKWRTALRAARPALEYYPVVDSGWDCRPWAAYRGGIVWGRTLALFEEWLRQGREFCLDNDIPLLVLGPANEWGEGSYLEPCTEHGFGMYEAVRRVLGQGAPETWPENLTPPDVGLGPYDLPMGARGAAWTFDSGAEGWTGGGCKMEAREGALWITSLNDDPTLQLAADLRAETVKDLVIRLRCTGGTDKGNYAQLFWATEGDAISGASLVGFTFEDSDQWREYRVPLSTHPRWRGRITQLRFDPCCEAGLTVIVDEMRLE